MLNRLCILFVLYFSVTTFTQAAVVEIGTNRQLLVDDYIVDGLSNLRRVVQQPKRVSTEPILKKDRPWEGDVLQMPCVQWDPAKQIFHMYYWSARSEGTYTCYARSKDGINWEKPILNLHAGPDGSKANNIVLRGTGKVARTRYVVLNPDQSDPKRRFLAMYIDNVPGLTEFAASSPDGLHWTTEKKIGDLRHVRGGEVSANPPFFLIEQQWGKDADDGHRYRAIWRTESQDMKKWTGGRLVIERLPDDDPNVEFYHACSHFMGSHTYHGLHFGYLYLFHTETARGVRKDGIRLAGTVDTSLMVSRDTIKWTRLDRSRRFLPLGPEGSWEAKMNYVSPEVVSGDRMLFYYSGWRKEHAAKDNEAGIGLATLPLDRFVAVQPVKRLGSLTTKPFVVEGSQLVVNANADGGYLRIEVLTKDSKQIQGFDAAACTPLTGDSLNASVTWRSRSLDELKGKTVRLRFHLDRSSLFAFQLISLPAVEQSTEDLIAVRNPKTLATTKIPCKRIRLGKLEDYKPSIVLLPSGELLLSMFSGKRLPNGKIAEQTVLYRSADGGLTWSEREEPNIAGREPALSVTKNGTVLITTHLLRQDVRNKKGFTHSYVHRSEDGGRTWTSTHVQPKEFRTRTIGLSTRNVLQLADGSLMLGISEHVINNCKSSVWRSTDDGKTWSERYEARFANVPKDYPYTLFGEAHLWQAQSGQLYAILRVGAGNTWPIDGTKDPGGNDQSERMIVYTSSDVGRTWSKVRDLGNYGQMYMSILRVAPKRLLLTFTQRAISPPLGVRAVLGHEFEDGFKFDMNHDLIMIDTKTPQGLTSGGGFGPTVMLADGTLVTAYTYRGKDNKKRAEIVRWRLSK